MKNEEKTEAQLLKEKRARIKRRQAKIKAQNEAAMNTIAADSAQSYSKQVEAREALNGKPRKKTVRKKTTVTKKRTTKKKTTKKKTTKKKTTELSASAKVLAEKIHSDRAKELSELMEMEDEANRGTHEFQTKPTLPEQPNEIKRIDIEQGLSPMSAIKIVKYDREVNDHLDHIFNKKYFILSTNTQTRSIRGQYKKYSIVMVEDENNFRYIIWFDVSALSLI